MLVENDLLVIESIATSQTSSPEATRTEGDIIGRRIRESTRHLHRCCFWVVATISYGCIDQEGVRERERERGFMLMC